MLTTSMQRDQTAVLLWAILLHQWVIKSRRYDVHVRVYPQKRFISSIYLDVARAISMLHQALLNQRVWLWNNLNIVLLLKLNLLFR